MSPLPLPDGGSPRRELGADSVSSSLSLIWLYPFRCDHTGLAAGRVVGKGNLAPFQRLPAGLSNFKQRDLDSNPRLVATSSLPLSACPSLEWGNTCAVSRPAGEGRGLLTASVKRRVLPPGPGPSVPGAGKGVGARAGRDWAFVPSRCPWPGLGKPAGAGLGAGLLTGRVSAWQYQRAQAQAGGWGQPCLPRQLLE